MFSILYFIVGLTGIAIRPLIPIVSEDLKIGLDMIGFMLSVMSFGFFISVILGGYLSDRYGTKLIILIGLVISTMSSLGLGSSYIYFILLLSGLLIGIGRGMLFAGMNTHIINTYPERRGAMLLKLNQFFCLGMAVGPVIISINLFLKLDWRVPFIIFFFIYLIITSIFLRNKVIEDRKNFKKKSIKNFYKKNTKKASSLSEKIYLKEYLHLFKNPVIVLSGLLLIFFGGSVVPFSTWFTTYFSSLGVEVKVSSLGLSLYWLSVTAGVKIKQIVLNFLKEHKIVLLGCLLNTIFMIIITFSANVIVKITASVIMGLSLGGFTALITSLATSQKPKLSGFISGYILGMLSLGNMIFQPFIGYISERFGRGSEIYIELMGSLLLLITAFILANFYKNRKSNVETV